MWNSTKLKKYKNADKWHSRITLTHSRTRLYCRECRELRRIQDCLNGTCVLECQHRRPVFFPMSREELTALKKFVASEDGARAMQKQARVIGTEDDTDSQHNWRHATTVSVEDVVEQQEGLGAA
jgi:hypothetical protein